MLGWLFQTDGSIVPLVLRLTLAVVMFPHGAQKTLGWFGGHGFKGAMGFMTKSGIPGPLAVLAIMAEFLGPLGLAVGLLTGVAARARCTWMVRRRARASRRSRLRKARRSRPSRGSALHRSASASRPRGAA